MSVIWAVHILDGYLEWPWLVSGFLIASLLAWLGSRRLREEEIPRIAVLSAGFFVASWIHVPSPVPGTSVHLLFNGLVGVILGPRAALAIPLGLVLQALLFGHGGLYTLGVNCCVMVLPALAAWLVFKGIRERKWFQEGGPGLRWIIGFALGGGTVLLTITLNALILWLGRPEVTFLLAAVAFLAHLPVAAVEACIIAATVGFLAKVKPEMLGLQPPVLLETKETEPPTSERQAG